MKRLRPWKWQWLALPPLLLAGLCGCVAVDVGKPETFTIEVPAGDETRAVEREVLFSQVVAETGGGAGDGGTTVPVLVSLRGQVDRTEQKGRMVRVVDVTRQKRLSFGLFPGTAEWVYRPEGCAIAWGDMTPSGMTEELQRQRIRLQSLYAGYDLGAEPMPAGMLPLQWALLGGSGALFAAPLVPWFLLAEPFAGNWTCQSHLCWLDKGVCWQADGEGDFRELEAWRTDVLETLVHCVPLGFFRHSFFRFSEGRDGGWTPTGAARHVREDVVAKGPYRVELSIPQLGFTDSRAAWRGTERVRFEVPRGAAPGETVALVKFRVDGPVDDPTQRALLEDAAKWTQAVPLWLPGPAGAEVGLVVEGARVRGAPLRFAKERDAGNGGVSWVVEILDDSREELDVAAFARPLILAELREEWLERHPQEDEGNVGAKLDWRSGGDGRTLVFTGSAFSVRPVADGWRYDAATRRGEVRLKVVGEEVDAEAVRGWARENVESIARDRAVVLEVGGMPSEGGSYRSLSEQFENGVLRLEFEVVQ